MDERLEQLRARKAEIRTQIEATIATADAERRDMTDDELSAVQALEVESSRVDKEVETRERHLARQREDAASKGRRTDPAPADRDDQLSGGRPAPRPGTAAAPRVPAEAKDGRLGFRSFGEFALSVQRAAQDGGIMDRRLEQLAPSTYGNSGSGSDGGFLIPPDFRAAIMSKVMGDDSLVSRTDQLTTSSNSLTVPVDETEPWSTGGVRAYWEGEGAQKRQSKPTFKDTSFKLNKLAAIVVVTDELLEDAPALDAYLRRKVPQAMTYKVNEALLFGTGAGMPLGAVNGPAKVRVSKESGQAADTVVYANIAKMWNRMYGPSRRNAVWLVNQDVEPQLETMYIATGANSGELVYLPPGGVAGNPYATLRGRPVIPVENARQLGDEGDIILWDPSTYLTLTKTAGQAVKTDVSIHLYFDYDMTAYRFVMRVGGQNWWNAPITPANGSNTRSNVVTLEDRA